MSLVLDQEMAAQAASTYLARLGGHIDRTRSGPGKILVYRLRGGRDATVTGGQQQGRVRVRIYEGGCGC